PDRRPVQTGWRRAAGERLKVHRVGDPDGVCWALWLLAEAPLVDGGHVEAHTRRGVSSQVVNRPGRRDTQLLAEIADGPERGRATHWRRRTERRQHGNAKKPRKTRCK